MDQNRKTASNKRGETGTQAKKIRLLHWSGVLFASSGLILIIILLIAGLILFRESDRILPGIRVMDLDLGGESVAAAEVTLQRAWQNRYIQLRAGDLVNPVSAETLGFHLDARATTRLAHLQGRSSESLTEWVKAGRQINISPVWSFHAEYAENVLRALAWETDIGARNAALSVLDGRVEIQEAIVGQALDVGGALSWLEAHAAAALESGSMELPVTPVEPAVTDVAGIATEISRWLVGPALIDLYDPIRDESQRWTLTPATIGDWIQLNLTPADSNELGAWLELAELEEHLAGLSATLGPERYVDVGLVTPLVAETIMEGKGRHAQARIMHQERQHIVREGETLSSIAVNYGIPYPWIQSRNPGLANTLMTDQVVRIPSPDLMLPLPVVRGKRVVVSLAEQSVRAYEDGRLKWDWIASTGMPSSPTSPGVFQIQTHETEAYAASWNLWMPYFMGIYRPVPESEFMNGFHGFTTRNGQPLLWMRNLGTPVTYGCVLLSTENARLLYDWAEDGVVVEIQP